MKLFTKSIIFALILSGLTISAAWSLPLNPNRPYNSGQLYTTSNSEISLQQVLDGVFGTGTIDAVNDQSNVAVWTQAEGNVDAYMVTLLAGATNSLGVYSYNSGAKTLLTFDETHAASFFISSSGDLYVDGVLAISNFGQSFGFYIQSVDQNNNYYYFYTEDDENNNIIHALTYLISDNTSAFLNRGTAGTVPTTFSGDNDWVLAFNDYGNDLDFQDAVYIVEDIDPVPEPATIMLLGAGLVGLGGWARKGKKSAKKA